VWKSSVQRDLESGRQVSGVFSPVGADFATPGVLSWSVDEGVSLELIDRGDPWPTDFGPSFTVHGNPYEGDSVTILDARVRRIAMGDQSECLLGLELFTSVED
jgi:hypothetical protein